MPRGTPRNPLTWLGGLIAAYLILPLVAFVVRFLSVPTRGFGTPGLFPALWISISCATISLVLITLFGVPLAYYLARSRSRTASVIGVLVHLPLALPPLMSGIVLIYLVGPYTFLGQLFGEHLTDSMTGIVITMTFCAAPFLIVAARAGFVTLDEGPWIWPPLLVTPRCRASYVWRCPSPDRESAPACSWRGYEPSASTAPLSSLRTTRRPCPSTRTTSSAGAAYQRPWRPPHSHW